MQISGIPFDASSSLLEAESGSAQATAQMAALKETLNLQEAVLELLLESLGVGQNVDVEG
jgi:hypothetical protein